MEDRLLFVHSSYFPSGRPKGEDLLMSYAKDLLLYRLVKESELPDILQELNEKQDAILLGNPRLKKTEIRFTNAYRGDTGRGLRIGECSMTFLYTEPWKA